jgi:uncharacterized membrane protein YqjE
MEPEKSLLHSFEDLRKDLKGFIETRYEILRAELSGGVKKAQRAVALFVAAAIFAIVGFILLGFCVSLAIGLAFGAFTNQVGLVWGFLITGFGNLLLAAILGSLGKARLKAANLIPERTLRVLQRDQQALQQQRGGQYVGPEPERSPERPPERRRA